MTRHVTPIATRFERWSFPEPNSGCVIWFGYIDPKGYGRINVNGKSRRTHVVAYEINVGPIPFGKQLDHLCRNRACCAEWHLEPVTPRENVLRGNTIAARNAAKTECIHGHPFDESNTCTSRPGWRDCRTCKCERARKSRLRAAMAAEQRQPTEARP
jgi:hypothetical protein